MSWNIVSYDFFNKKVINIINAIQNYKKKNDGGKFKLIII